MKFFIIYDKTTGVIDRTFSGTLAEAKLNVLQSEDYLLRDISLKNGKYYVSGGVYAVCTKFDLTYDSTTGQYNTPFWLHGIPAGTIISGSWFKDRISLGESEVFTLELGTHWIQLVKARYVDYLIKLTVSTNSLKVTPS